ncbi:hypothetical protein ACFQZ2_04355 [Streptomonospora algeriensis]|uniref:Uncharacterized protein n=1 Tax=Streptomonospora algeriensis TaxID=995084 RepID=A0ABW3BD88_9ACTN
MTELALLVTSIVVTGGILIVAILQVAQVRRTKIHGGREAQYEALAQEAVEAQQAAARTNAELTESVKRLEARVAALEKLLREVE